MNHKTWIFFIFLMVSNFSFATETTATEQNTQTENPNHKTSAVMSRNCNMEKLREVIGDALVEISPQSWNDTSVPGFVITLDTTKLSFSDLTKKMVQNNCF